MKHIAPIATVDVVLLALLEDRLCVALVRRDNPDEPFCGHWALPGGFVRVEEDEDLEAAAVRVLSEKLDVQSPYLEQLRTFSGRSRDPRGWSLSVAYYALVSPELLVQTTRERVRWEAVDTLKSLPFDHAGIVQAAVERVRSKTAYSSLPLYLMPATFSLAELRRVYETLLGAEMDARSFGRRMQELDVLEPVQGAKSAGAYRPAQLYRVKRRARGLALTEDALPVKA
jgi:8-oxo-dGTP diphosphatase